MYGKLTRETEEWYPEGLLCKRFNLKNPHAGKPKPVKKETQSNMLGVLDNQLPIDTPTSFELQNNNNNNNNNNNTNVSQFEQTIEMQTIDNEEDIRDNLDAQLETEKPPIDLFKAIFENEEEEQVDKVTAEEDTEVPTITIDNNSETKLFNNNDNNQIDNDDKRLKNETIVNSKFEIINLERKMEVDPTVKTIVFDNLSNNNTSRTTETTTINVESNPYLYYPPKRYLTY